MLKRRRRGSFKGWTNNESNRDLDLSTFQTESKPQSPHSPVLVVLVPVPSSSPSNLQRTIRYPIYVQQYRLASRAVLW